MPRKSRHPIQKTMSLSEEAASSVQALAEERGVPESQVFREAVEMYLEAQQGDQDDQAGPADRD